MITWASASGTWHYLLLFSAACLCLALLFSIIRILLGPTLADRVLAVDMGSNIIISVVAVYAVLTQHNVYIDVIIAIALIIFLGTVAFAKYLTYKPMTEDQEVADADE